ncbi:MAG: 3'-5' exonuclease [Desulfuromonadales bacterium]|nr:3'-5' exonuclease [Desulfuromonadales bacterium]
MADSNYPLRGTVKRMISIDVETSGISPLRGSRVIEVAAVEIWNGQAVAEFASLIDVACCIHPAAERVHCISSEMLRGSPGPEEVWASFLKFAGNSPLIAHNAAFDIGFIRHELALLGLSLTNRSICTLKLARRRFPRLGSHRLEAVARHVLGGIPDDCSLHRALGDARLAGRVWVALNGS